MTSRPKDRKSARHVLLAAVALLLLQAASASEVERQRELFRSVFADVEMGRWAAVESLSKPDRALLERYVLWPDLRAAWFRARMRTVEHDAGEAFLDRYEMLKPARELRYRYALHLARAGDLERYLEIYNAFYRGLGVAQLDCIALHADIRAGRGERVTERASELWMTGDSQAKECDPVFRHLKDANLLTEEDYRARYALAFESREFSRARWLARSIDASLVEEASSWLHAQSNPDRFIDNALGKPGDETKHRQLAYAVQRLAVRDPARARERWDELRRSHSFPGDLVHETSRHIALHAAYDRLDGAYEQLIGLPG